MYSKKGVLQAGVCSYAVAVVVIQHQPGSDWFAGHQPDSHRSKMAPCDNQVAVTDFGFYCISSSSFFSEDLSYLSLKNICLKPKMGFIHTEDVHKVARE